MWIPKKKYDELLTEIDTLHRIINYYNREQRKYKEENKRIKASLKNCPHRNEVLVNNSPNSGIYVCLYKENGSDN